jgi:membrane fusion protein, multidrug efflux system
MTRVHNRFALLALSTVVMAATAAAQTTVDVVRVTARSVDREVKLPGELRPYLAVPIHARMAGFVKRVEVDRGSTVRQGQVLVTLEAPEMQAHIVEAESRAQAVELQRAEALAKLAGAQSTYDRLKAASATAGVVAENDVVVAQKTVEAAQALVRSYDDSIKAAQAQAQSVRDLAQYLRITAPFDGVVTERNIHPGALVGPGTGETPMLRLHQLTRLRLVVAVPELLVGAIVKGARVPFAVPAYPGETFFATLNMVAPDLDARTRTLSVELSVQNPGLRLGAGMYPEVRWPVRRPQPSLLVPPTAIATTTERTFVVRIRNGVAEWVNVSRGARVGELVEVYGELKDGDTIARRGTDELREGTRVNAQAPVTR